MLQIGFKSTGERWRDNYITPPDIVETVKLFCRSVGETDYFDPCPINPKEDGLKTNWVSSSKVIYVNPPFSDYSTWLNRGIFHKEFINTIEETPDINLIYICNTSCETQWYRNALSHANVELRTNFRVKFIDPQTNKPATSPPRSNTFFYFGKHKLEFIKCFSKYGIGLDLDLWRANISQIFPDFKEF